MTISKIQNNLFEHQAKNQVLHLREGQIIKGEIKQLYQDNRAKVRIGSSNLIAQLQTALSVGESYYFQVNESNEQIYLQVVQGEGANRTANIESLMSQLKLRGSKVNVQFLEGLIARGIPFNPSQVHQAVHILQQQHNKTEAITVLHQMFKAKLPITENVFQALATFDSNQFTTVLESVYQSLHQANKTLSNDELLLMKLIQQMIQHPNSLNEAKNKQLLQQIRRDPMMFAMYQMLGVFDVNLSREETINRLERYLQTNQNQQSSQLTIENKTQQPTHFNQINHEISELLRQDQAIIRTALKAISIYHPVQTNALNEKEFRSLIRMIEHELLPLLPKRMQQNMSTLLGKMTLDDQSSLETMLRGLSNQKNFTNLEYEEVALNLRDYLQSSTSEQLTSQQKKNIVQTAIQIINQHQLDTTTLSKQQLTTLIQQLEQELLPQLPKQIADHLGRLLQQTSNQNQSALLSLLITLGNEHFMTISPQQASHAQQMPIQHQLLTQISYYMESLGLTMEHDYIQVLQSAQQANLQTVGQADTIKALLLQMIQQGGQQSEQINQLVHFLNGLQLQSLTESNQMLQAQMFISGNPFALNDDIFMKFESKKTSDGKIDEDYCRIIFMLDLAQLQETIIDMQIQKRIITVTIFNDVIKNIPSNTAMLSSMKDNLQKLDYQLSTVDWKPLSKQEGSLSDKEMYQANYQKQKGFDLKI